MPLVEAVHWAPCQSSFLEHVEAVYWAPCQLSFLEHVEAVNSVTGQTEHEEAECLDKCRQHGGSVSRH